MSKKPLAKLSFEIYQEFLAPQDLELLKRYCLELNPGSRGLHVRELGRHGNTNARLLLANFNVLGGIPLVVKLANGKDVRTEANAIESVKLFFPDANRGHKPIFAHGRGVLAYEHVGAVTSADVDQSLDLEQVTYNRKVSHKRVSDALSALYKERCLAAHMACQRSTCVMIKEYERYLRDMAAEGRIKSVLGPDYAKESLSYLGSKILNPLIAIKKDGFKKSIVCKIGPVHGDLHPTNVVLNCHMKPSLIDFAWANANGHVLKDFVLMENSIRFMLFPNHTNWPLQKKCNSDLLDEYGFEKLQDSPYKGSDLEWHYARLAVVLRAIREAAKAVGGPDYKFEEYLAAQYLVLFGLLKFNTYPIHCCTRTLGLIGSRLQSSGWIA